MRLETSSIKELTNAHRMGHTCANLNGDLFFIWGGSDESVAHMSIENNHLWIYDTFTGYWRHHICTGDCPPYLSGSASSLIGQRMFVFGGHSTNQDDWTNNLFCLDLDNFVWENLGNKTKAEPAKPIKADKLVSWSYQGRLYIFGGYGWTQTEHLLELLDRQKDLQLAPDHRWPKYGWNNQLVEFDTRDNTWTWPSYSGKCPSARAAHSGALMGSTYYLFGGRDMRERLNDLYTLDMETFTWTQIATFSTDIISLERPIRHQLEGEESEGGEDEAAADDEHQSINEDIIEDMEDLVTPSPSSSSHDQRQQQQQYQELDNMSSSSLDNDTDEEAEYPFDHPNSSHLLERWSLSSHTSGPSSSIMNVNNEDCRLDQQTPSSCPTQEQQMEPNIQADDISQQVNLNEMLPAQQPETSDTNEPNDMNDRGSSITVQEIVKPIGRSFASFTPISDKDILLYGGINSQDENLDDCWIFNITRYEWKTIDLKNKHPRLWHTGAKTKNNEVVIIGGSCSDKIDKICTDILTISLTPKTLKRLALDASARSIRMRTINRVKGLPSTINKLIRLRKQAISVYAARRLPTRPLLNGTAQAPGLLHHH